MRSLGILFALVFPGLWLFLPNILLIFLDPDLGLQLKSLGLLLTIFCTSPLILLFSKNLRQFWLWNLPFALASGFYSGFILYYHTIPYDGMWFTLWSIKPAVLIEFLAYFWWKCLLGLLGFIIYVICLCHPIQAKIQFTSRLRQAIILSSLFCTCVLLITTNFFSRIIPIQKMLDETIVFKNYPYGMLLLAGKAGVALSKKVNLPIPPLKRSFIPAGREIYILVIGEAARYDYWLDLSQQMHFPLLSPNLKVFPNVASQGNLTSISEPLILTGTSKYQQANILPSWPRLAKAAGCTTGWITNTTEPNNYAYDNDFYDLNVDRYALIGISTGVYDDVLLPEIQRAISQGPQKLCLTVHLIGSHFDYRSRYRADFAKYPVNNKEYDDFSSGNHKYAFRNAFKNSLIETNYLLVNIINMLKNEPGTVFLLYTSDHAESFDDDDLHLYFHGNFHPNQIEMHVPFFIWANENFQKTYPKKWQALLQNQNRKISNIQILPTLLDALSVEQTPNNYAPSLLQVYNKDVERVAQMPQMNMVNFDDLP